MGTCLPMSYHLGVNKTQDRNLQHISIGQSCEAVYQSLFAYHVCQMVGKPNHTVKTAPLKPVPAFHEAFSKVIIGCVAQCPRKNLGSGWQSFVSLTRVPEIIWGRYHPRSLSNLWPRVSISWLCPKKFNLTKVPISHLEYLNWLRPIILNPKVPWKGIIENHTQNILLWQQARLGWRNPLVVCC